MTRVLLDIDGIIADFVSWYRLVAEMELQRDLEVVDPENWDIGIQLGLVEHERDRVWEATKRMSAAYIRPYAESLEPVRLLLSDPRVDVYFVTASLVGNATWEHCRRRWLDRYFGEEASKHLVFTSEKYIVTGDVFVDDKASSVHVWAAHHPQGMGVVWARPWNIGQEGALKRTDSWVELLGIVRHLAGA